MNTSHPALHHLAAGAPTRARLIAIKGPPVARPDIELSSPQANGARRCSTGCPEELGADQATHPSTRESLRRSVQRITAVGPAGLEIAPQRRGAE
jgi:hypothetical protein